MASNPAPATTKSKPKIFYGWVIAGIVALAHFTESAEIFPVLGVLIKPMTEEFGWSRSEFTLATSIGTLLGGFVGPIVGPMIDKYGARWILIISYTILGATMIGQALITELWQFYAMQITARFFALGVISLALQIIIPKWFIKKRARAIAYSGLGGRLGNMVTPLYVTVLVSAFDWRVASATTGLVMLSITLLPIALFLKRRPEDMGLLPDGATPEELERERADAAQRGVAIKADISYTLQQVLRMPSFYLLMAATIFNSLVGPALNLHMIPYFTDKGLSDSTAALVTTTLFGTSAIGSLAFGYMVERFNIRPTVAFNYSMMGVAFLLLLAVRTPEMAFAWAIFQGLLQGGSMTLFQTLFADYYGRESLGSIRGVLAPVQLTTNAIGPLAAAFAFDTAGTYTGIFLLFGIFRLVSGFLVLAAKPPTAPSGGGVRSEERPADQVGATNPA